MIIKLYLQISLNIPGAMKLTTVLPVTVGSSRLPMGCVAGGVSQLPGPPPYQDNRSKKLINNCNLVHDVCSFTGFPTFHSCCSDSQCASLVAWNLSGIVRILWHKISEVILCRNSKYSNSFKNTSKIKSLYYEPILCMLLQSCATDSGFCFKVVFPQFISKMPQLILFTSFYRYITLLIFKGILVDKNYKLTPCFLYQV